MRRYLWRGSLLIALVFCALFPKAIFLKFIEWETALVFKKQWNATFTFDALFWEKGAVIFQNGKIFKEGCIESAFSTASWRPNIALFKRELGGHLEIEGLKIIKKNLHALRKFEIPKKRWLYLNFDLLAPDAHFHFGDVELIFDLEKKEDNFTFTTDLLGHNLRDLYHTFCTLFHGQIPNHLVGWEIIGGELKGETTISFSRKRIDKLKGKIEATEIEAKHQALELCGEWDTLLADFDIDIGSSLTWNGMLTLLGGQLNVQDSTFWNLSDLHSTISIQEGKIESSFLRGKFMGMEGEVDLDWLAHENLVELSFQGNSSEILPLIPKRFQQGFGVGFPDDQFAVDALVKRTKEGLKLEGTLAIAEEYSLNFGCHFGEVAKNVEVVPQTLPILSLPMDHFLDNLKQQFCLSDKRLGWFQGEGFLLEKFLSPFLPLQDSVSLLGKINFEGTFDERYLIIFYEGENFHLEGNSFALQVDHVNEDVSSNIVAAHYIDLKTKDHVGVLPIAEAQYRQKKQNVVFAPLRALVHIENDQIRIKEIETSWRKLELQGEANLSLNDLDFTLSVPTCQGPLEDAIELCNHFVSLQVPFVGEISSRGEGLQIHHNQESKSVTFSGRCLANAHFNLCSFKDNEFYFDYDSKEKKMTVSEAKGSMVFKKREYEYGIPLLQFSPELWELKMYISDFGDVTGKIENGDLKIAGEKIEVMGTYQEGHLQIPHYQIHDYFGSMELQKNDLKQFSIKKGKNVLQIAGKFDESKHFYGEVEHVVFDLAILQFIKGTIEGRGTLQYDGELQTSLLASFHEFPFGLYFSTPSVSLDKGKVTLFKEDESVTVFFENGWQLAEIKGKLLGCEAALKVYEEPQNISLIGRLSFDAQMLLYANRLPFQLDTWMGNYTLEGKWSFNRQDLFNPTFVGNLEGVRCGMHSVMCDHIHSDLEYRDKSIRLQNLVMTDWSGKLRATNIFLDREGKFSCEKVALENFRLSRLKSPWTEMEKRNRPLFRSFCIPYFTLNQFCGQLGDMQTFSGEGVLHFTNYCKRTLFSNLMQLPTEITARLGLDLTTLIPVKGEVLFKIQDEKIYLNEFKDVFSDGKRARFYLASEEPAYIDFKGNLDFKVRMKQYTLLMKLAEFFTLSVKGTLVNPLYTLINQLE